MAFTVFISYSTKDITLVDNIRRALAQYPAQLVHPYVAEYDAAPGTRLDENIKKHLLASDMVCVLWSKNAQKSDWVPQEIGIAEAAGKLIVPIVLDKGLQLPGFIKDRKYIPAYDGLEMAMGAFSKLVLVHATEKAVKNAKDKDALVLLGLGAVLLLVVASGD